MTSVVDIKNQLGDKTENAPLLIGDTLYPPDARNDPVLCIQAIEQASHIGIKYRPIKARLESLNNALIDCFIGREDNPAKLIEFVDGLKIRRPELAVKLLERILDDNKPQQTQIQTNQNRPAPIVIVNNGSSPQKSEPQSPIFDNTIDEVPADSETPENLPQTDNYAPIVIPPSE